MLYVAAGMFLVHIIEAARYRSPALAFLSIACLAPAVAVGVASPWVRAVDYFATAALALVGLFVAHILGPGRVKDWKRIKARRECVRKVTLHLVLLTGSAIFIVPFVWLVTTSLKEEDQIFKYPPVWIPTRQAMVRVSASPVHTSPYSAPVPHPGTYPLSTMKIAGRTIRVAEVAELEDGRKRVLILPGQPDAGKVLLVERSSLTKVRRFGLKWENYTEALDFLPAETLKGLVYVWNTVYVTMLSIIGTLLSSSLVAYSFARLRWPGRDTLFLVLLATMMLPGAVTMIPVFLIFRALGWVDTLRPLWIPSFFGGAFSVFLLRQFFMTIPMELEDAAKIDGCSYFGIYRRIMLPLIKPALAALTIMTFMGSWNNFMGPLIYINSPEKMTLAYGLQLFQGAHAAEYGLLMAASTLVMLPVLLVFFFTQRYFIQGITLTGIKG